MKKINYFLTFLVFNFSLFAQITGPKISALSPEFDFGDVKEGIVLKHNFVISNTGGQVLQISKVKASCGCTAAKPSRNEIKPNDTTSIKVSFDTSRRMGQQQKYVYIFSNDSENPQYRLSFKANIISSNVGISNGDPEIKLSKYSQNFGNVKEGQILKTTVEISNIGKSVLEISEIKSSCGCTATFMKDRSLKPNEKSNLNIDFNTKDLKGPIVRTVTLISNDPQFPSRVVTLIANIEKE